MRESRQHVVTAGAAFRPVARTAVLCLACLAAAGCASTSTFRPHTSRMAPLLEAVRRQQPLPFPKTLAGPCRGADRVLYLLERGRLAQVQGNRDQSLADFAAAAEAVRQADERAVVSATGVAAQGIAVALNDNAIPYRAAGYERVMLHHFQTLNHLGRGDLEGAGVEARIATQEQHEALVRHEKEIGKARAEAERGHVSLPNGGDAVSQAYAGLDELAGQVKDSFQNAAAFYLAGMVREMLGDDDAYIDYKKALELAPANGYLQRDVLRLARQQGRSEEAAALQARFPGVVPDLLAPAGATTPDSGEVIVWFEDGLVPQKEPIKIPIPIPAAYTVVAAAFPIYRAYGAAPAALTVSAGGTVLGRTELVCRMDALAVKALKEEVPVMAVRQILRATAKGVAAKKASDDLGPLGGIGAGVWNYLSENADLRSWTSLPANVQVLRLRLPAGAQALDLQQPGLPVSAHVQVTMPPRGRVLLQVMRVGSSLYGYPVVVSSTQQGGR